LTKNGKKVLNNIEGMARWLEDYQKRTFGVSGDWTGGDPDLSDYFFDFHSEFSDFERTSGETELLNEIRKSSLIFIGDFHNLRQSQKFTAELIEKITQDDRSGKILAVEFLSPGDQKAIDEYQSGRISEETFLKKVDFKSWNDPRHWQGYRKVLSAARKNGIKVFGIKTGRAKNQAERDLLFALNLKNIAVFYPDDKIIINIGDAHLAENHLPAKMLALPEFHDRRMIRVLKNLPKIYFSALRRYENFRLPKILKIKNEVYHVMIAPMITQLLSNIENLEYRTGADKAEGVWTEGDLIMEIFQCWADLLKIKFDLDKLPEFHIENEKKFRLKKVLEELAGSVFGGPESFRYFCSKLFIPERRPENVVERAGEKMFLDFLRGKQPVIPRD